MAAPTPIALSPHRSPAYVPVLMAPSLVRNSTRNLSTHPKLHTARSYQGGAARKGVKSGDKVEMGEEIRGMKEVVGTDHE